MNGRTIIVILICTATLAFCFIFFLYVSDVQIRFSALMAIRVLVLAFWMCLILLPILYFGSRDAENRLAIILPFIVPLLGLIVWHVRTYLDWKEAVAIISLVAGLNTFPRTSPPLDQTLQLRWRWQTLGLFTVFFTTSALMAWSSESYKILGAIVAAVFVRWGFVRCSGRENFRKKISAISVFCILTIVIINWAVATSGWLVYGATFLYSALLLALVTALFEASTRVTVSALEADRFAHPITMIAVTIVLFGLFGYSIYGNMQWLEIGLTISLTLMLGGAIGVAIAYVTISENERV